MTDSILTSVKETLGLGDEQTSFDNELVLFINSVFATLNQLGVGPAEGYTITGTTEVWDSFLGTDKKFEPAKLYTHLRVKLVFDPPEIGFVLTAMKEQIKELEYRLNVASETPSPEVVVVEETTVTTNESLLEGF